MKTFAAEARDPERVGVRNQQVTRSSRVAGSNFPKKFSNFSHPHTKHVQLGEHPGSRPTLFALPPGACALAKLLAVAIAVAIGAVRCSFVTVAADGNGHHVRACSVRQPSTWWWCQSCTSGLADQHYLFRSVYEGAIGSTKTIENDHGLALSRKRNPSMWSPFLGRPEAT